MRWGAVGILVALAGCAAPTRIEPAGPNTYVVTVTNDACDNCAAPRTRASEAASAYCARMNRAMVVKGSNTDAFDIAADRRTTLTFSCLSPEAE